MKLQALSGERELRPGPPAQTPQKSVRGLLPFYLIEAFAICSDAILILATSVLTGFAYYHFALDSVLPITAFLGVGFLTFLNFSTILAARAAYQPRNLVNFWRQVRETTIIWLFVFVMLLLIAFLLKVGAEYSRGATLTFFAAGLVVITLWRLAIAHFLAHALAVGAFAERKAVVLAESDQLEGSTAFIELNRCGYRLVRALAFSRSSVSSASASPSLLKTFKDILEITRQEPIECLFLLVPWDDPRLIEALMAHLRVLSIPIYLLPDRNVEHLLSNRIVNIGTAWTAELTRAPLSATEQLCKRSIDLLLAAVGLVILTPIMALVAIWIKLETRGPVFFVQRRSGFNGRTFKIYKFRTMTVEEDGPTLRQATRNDPRITNCGRFLRRANLDELPQLLNVLIGNMSLVGPRPHPLALNFEYENIIGNYAFRHHVKPGLTGWAQVNGLRGETQTVDLMTRRVELDLWYIDNWSLWLDFRILVRTLFLGLQPTAY